MKFIVVGRFSVEIPRAGFQYETPSCFEALSCIVCAEFVVLKIPIRW